MMLHKHYVSCSLADELKLKLNIHKDKYAFAPSVLFVIDELTKFRFLIQILEPNEMVDKLNHDDK